MEIDLDEARRAREEAAREAGEVVEPKSFRFGGEVFELPPELPFEFIEALGQAASYDGARSAAALGQALRSVMPGRDIERLYAKRPLEADILALVRGLSTLYGEQKPGESPASDAGSTNGSGPSKPTS